MQRCKNHLYRKKQRDAERKKEKEQLAKLIAKMEEDRENKKIETNNAQ